MILVDSSVWIDFFRMRLVTADLVLTEVLQGARSEQAASRIEDLLLSLDVVTVSDRGVAVEAARHYRWLRAKGITIRSTIDVLIATRCIVDDRQLLHSDRDFDPFVEHCGLRVAPLDFFGVH